MTAAPEWLEIAPGDAPLIISFPHTGTEVPAEVEAGLISPWRARKDADWWIERVYAFAADTGATLILTRISRTVIDVNRDPSGVSLYPGAATTGLCPTTTFDGEALYRTGLAPDAAEVARRREVYFAPYHRALSWQIARLKALHGGVVLYDAHSIRSRIPRLFEGVLPQFNIGDNGGASCDPRLTAAVETACGDTPWSRVTNGRFRGGYITRHYGAPREGVHALQMELACRGYMIEPSDPPTPDSWPTPYDPAFAEPLIERLKSVIGACLEVAPRLSRPIQ